MLREFTDRSGTAWRVWDVYPSTRARASVASSEQGRFRSAELADGWLCFESSSERRRLAPIPSGWEVSEPEVLSDYLSRAGYVSRRTSGEERKHA
jgi:hypothetical protein